MAKIDFESFLVWAYSQPEETRSIDFDAYLKHEGLYFNKKTKSFEEKKKRMPSRR